MDRRYQGQEATIAPLLTRQPLGVRVLRIGLVRKRVLYAYAFRRSQPITIGPGAAALIRPDGTVIVISDHLLGLDDDIQVSVEELLMRARVHREVCWDNTILWGMGPDMIDEITEAMHHALTSGWLIGIVRIKKPPNLVKMYRRLVPQHIRLETLLTMQQAISRKPALVAFIEPRKLGAGKPFWSYVSRGCVAGSYVNNALLSLGVRLS